MLLRAFIYLFLLGCFEPMSLFSLTTPDVNQLDLPDDESVMKEFVSQAHAHVRFLVAYAFGLSL